MKRLFLLLFCTFLLASAFILPAMAVRDAYSWYCVRNKDHKQPRLDAEMRFIEEFDGYHVDKTHGDDCAEKVLYLTFDAGYENGNIEKTLDILKEQNVSAAFFVLGNLIEKNPDLISRMEAEGHTVCNHTDKHRDMSGCTTKEEFEAELRSLEEKYYLCTGKQMKKYYRPPEGRFSLDNMKFAYELGYKTIFWSFAYADWDNDHQMPPEKAKEKILSNIHNGAIILLHPTSATNAEILEEIIAELKNEGYTFGTLDELTAS